MARTLVYTLTFLGALALGCGGDENGDGDGSGGYCLTGERDCSCNISGGCNSEEDSCIEGMCVACPAGTEGCGCRQTQPACDGDLMCQLEDPNCQLNCNAYCELS